MITTAAGSIPFSEAVHAAPRVEVQRPDLALQLAVGYAPATIALAGDDVTHTFTITNVGGDIVPAPAPGADPAPQPSVTLQDQLSSGLTWVGPLPAGCEGAGTANLVCVFSSLPVNASGGISSIVAKAHIPADAPDGTYSEDASIDAPFDPICPVQNGLNFGPPCVPPGCNGGEGVPIEVADNVACFQDKVSRLSAIDVILTNDTVGAVHPGGSYTDTLVVRNAGPSTLTGIELTDHLPEGVSIDGVVAGTGWNCGSTGPLVCTLAMSFPGDASPVLVHVTVSPEFTGTSIADTAIASAVYDTAIPQPTIRAARPTLAGGPFTVSNSVTTSVAVQRVADMSITESVSPPDVVAGDSLTWNLSVNNAGPDAANTVSVIDNVPSPLQIVSATSAALTCGVVGQLVTCTGPSLVAGGSATIVLTTTVPTGTGPQTVTNAADVSFVGIDPTPGDHHAAAATNVGTATPTTIAAANFTTTVALSPALAVSTTPPAAAPAMSIELPSTGTNSSPSLAAAMGLLSIGALLVALARRRRRTI